MAAFVDDDNDDGDCTRQSSSDRDRNAQSASPQRSNSVTWTGWGVVLGPKGVHVQTTQGV